MNSDFSSIVNDQINQRNNRILLKAKKDVLMRDILVIDMQILQAGNVIHRNNNILIKGYMKSYDDKIKQCKTEIEKFNIEYINLEQASKINEIAKQNYEKNVKEENEKRNEIMNTKYKSDEEVIKECDYLNEVIQRSSDLLYEYSIISTKIDSIIDILKCCKSNIEKNYSYAIDLSNLIKNIIREGDCDLYIENVHRTYLINKMDKEISELCDIIPTISLTYE